MMSKEIFIQQIEIYKVSVPLKEPFIISLGKFESAENIFIIIRTNIGITGYGECSPFPSIHGESSVTCFYVGQLLAKALIKKNPLEIESCIQMLDSAFFGNSSIKSALDMALYDIAAQHAGLPLYEYLGGKNEKMIQTDYTISFNAADKMAEDALKIKNEGFAIIKIKLGGEKEEDINRVRKIRKAVGDEIRIRIDANQGWSVTSGIEILNEIEKYKIEFCEEPIPRWNFMELSKVREQSTVPIMADETCCDHHDASRLIELKACDMFNIKLGKSSGIFNAMKMIRLAEKSGIKMQMGGFLESRLGFTASAHVALSSNMIVYHDFDTPLMHSEDFIQYGISYQHGGIIQVPDSAGTGAMPDEQYLKKFPNAIINKHSL